MDLQLADESGVTRVMLDGRLDTARVNAIELQFIAGIVPKAQATVIDLSRVTFIASLGVRMLLDASRSLARNGAKLALFGTTPGVLEMLEMIGLADIIPIVETEAEALATVAG